MTVVAVPVPGLVSEPILEQDRVEVLLDLALLADAGWDPADPVRMRFPSDQPVVGWPRCRTAGCGQEAGRGDRMCSRCANQRTRSGIDIDDFVQIPREGGRPSGGEDLCLVCRTVGHRRPAAQLGLCRSCSAAMYQRGQTVDEYVNGDDRFPPASPRPGFGDCVVDSCDRLAATSVPGMCLTHRKVWVAAGVDDLDRFCRLTAPVSADLRDGVWVGALPRLVLHQLLFGVQRCIVQGRQIRPGEFRRLCAEARRRGC